MTAYGLPVQAVLAGIGRVGIDGGAGSPMRPVGKVVTSGARNHGTRTTVQVRLATRRLEFFAFSKGLSPQEL